MDSLDSNNWTSGDYRALIREAIAGAFRPEDWLCVSARESGLVASRVPPSGTFAYNANGGARGLTQMMPRTLDGLGRGPGDPDLDTPARPPKRRPDAARAH